jgi:hypothetical protein
MGRARLMARQLSEQLEREVNAEELLKQQTRSSIPPPPAPAPPAALAPPETVSSPALESSPADATIGSEATSTPAIAPEPVAAAPVRRRTPHPNSPEMMHAKERMQADSPATVQPSTTPTPTTPSPQQSTQ